MAQSNQLLASDLYEPSTLFFDPDGEIMYFEVNGNLYKWKLRGREGPEWWLSEGYDTTSVTHCQLTISLANSRYIT